MNAITLDTYPDQFDAQDVFIESQDYDDQKRLFVVPITWVADYVLNTWGMTLNDFFKTCTWDDNWQLYEMAKQKGLLISERIERR